MGILQSAKETLPGWFTDHPLTKKILTDRAAAVREKRQAAATDLTRSTEAAAVLVAGYERSLQETKTAFADLRRQESELLAKQAEAGAKLRGETHGLSLKRSAAESFLRETSDPCIAEAISFFEEKIRFLCLPSTRYFAEGRGSKNAANFKQEITHQTNDDAIQKALEHCRFAISQLEAMRLSPEPDHAAIEKLRADVPDYKILTEKSFFGYPAP